MGTAEGPRGTESFDYARVVLKALFPVQVGRYVFRCAAPVEAS